MTQLPHCTHSGFSAPLPHIGLLSTPMPAPTPMPTQTATAATMTTTTVRPCCSMPYYPDANVRDKAAHSQDARKWFYVVKEGRIKGTFTNSSTHSPRTRSALATDQTNHYSNFSMRAQATFDGACDEWEENCRMTHGPVCPNAIPNGPRYIDSILPVSTTPSPAGSEDRFDSDDEYGDTTASFTSSQLSDALGLGSDATYSTQSPAGRSQSAQFATKAPASTPSRPPITSVTRLFPAAPDQDKLDEGKYWGVPSVLSTFATRACPDFFFQCVHRVGIQGIQRPNVWGHKDKKVVDDFIMSASIGFE
ncbi:hypothetical protein B0H16DRAFT_1471394 [Mycena metata]|uniref:Uncharacterized protein n=1 Tax=Mycena metata TaxID=1033252 RepID=A0AAD7HSF9_9AGAR|nr:hypothetical protein B0H16DRAFT_1471394 [Mycena metata]